MMGHENQQGYEEAHLYASKEEMESLVLDDVVAAAAATPTSSASSNGARPFRDPLSSSPPLVVIQATTADDTDPLHSPPSPILHPQNPSSSTSTSTSAVVINSILEPPSYADAVFRSFDADQYSVNGHDHSSPTSPSSTDYLKISVSHPSKEADESFYTYLITSVTNLEEFNGAEFNVRRRFRDVVTLSDRLTEAYRGLFIPIRPDKSVVESQVMQKNEFVEQRRAALEKYLRRLAKHPVIRRSEELRAFLTAQGKLPLVKTTDVASRMLDGAVNLPKQLFWGGYGRRGGCECGGAARERREGFVEAFQGVEAVRDE